MNSGHRMTWTTRQNLDSWISREILYNLSPLLWSVPIISHQFGFFGFLLRAIVASVSCFCFLGPPLHPRTRCPICLVSESFVSVCACVGLFDIYGSWPTGDLGLHVWGKSNINDLLCTYYLSICCTYTPVSTRQSPTPGPDVLYTGSSTSPLTEARNITRYLYQGYCRGTKVWFCVIHVWVYTFLCLW